MLIAIRSTTRSGGNASSLGIDSGEFQSIGNAMTGSQTSNLSRDKWGLSGVRTSAATGIEGDPASFGTPYPLQLIRVHLTNNEASGRGTKTVRVVPTRSLRLGRCAPRFTCRVVDPTRCRRALTLTASVDDATGLKTDLLPAAGPVAPFSRLFIIRAPRLRRLTDARERHVQP
jgi:hypothetical protein